MNSVRAVSSTGYLPFQLPTASFPPERESAMVYRPFNHLRFRIAVTLTIVMTGASAFGQGITVTGVGPVNRSMGGAGGRSTFGCHRCALIGIQVRSVVCRHPEMSFGTELLLADIDLSSTVGGVTGTTSGEAGVAAIPAIGWVHHVEDSAATIGLGIYGIAGFRTTCLRILQIQFWQQGRCSPMQKSFRSHRLSPTPLPSAFRLAFLRL